MIRSSLDDEPFSGLFDAPVRSLPYELTAGTDLAAHRHADPLQHDCTEQTQWQC